jgi:Uncharacterized protein conserved in bacteria (DUF2252)
MSAPEILFPKLVEHQGSQPRIKDDPPLIFHPTEEQAPGQRTAYAEAIEGYRASLPEHVRTLFDRFRFADLAIKVVGVGSVGTFCSVALFMAADDDPIFLQVKEARASVLEPYAGKSVHRNHGERVVTGQRLMQSASDIFLGWTDGAEESDYYFRHLRDVKISAVLDDWDAPVLSEYGKLCAFALARAHARTLRGRGAHGGLHGLELDRGRRGLRIRRRICRSEPSRLPRLREGRPGGASSGSVRVIYAPRFLAFALSHWRPPKRGASV